MYKFIGFYRCPTSETRGEEKRNAAWFPYEFRLQHSFYIFANTWPPFLCSVKDNRSYSWGFKVKAFDTGKRASIGIYFLYSVLSSSRNWSYYRSQAWGWAGMLETCLAWWVMYQYMCLFGVNGWKWVITRTLSLTSYDLRNSLNFSMLQFHHLGNGNDDDTHLRYLSQLFLWWY